jgi:hypothetical protein
VFSKVFLVQINQNFGNYIPKFVFKAKKTSENAFRILKLGTKTDIGRGKKSHGGGKRKFLIQAIHYARASLMEVTKVNKLNYFLWGQSAM